MSEVFCRPDWRNALLEEPAGLTGSPSVSGLLAGMTQRFTVEARVMTRRESVEKRHKRIRSKVGRAAVGAPARGGARRSRHSCSWLAACNLGCSHAGQRSSCSRTGHTCSMQVAPAKHSSTPTLHRTAARLLRTCAGGGHPRAATPGGLPLQQPHLRAGGQQGSCCCNLGCTAS